MSFRGYFKGKRVLVTGHTGFKGAWLAHWLKLEGAAVAGLSLAPEETGQPNLFLASNIAHGMDSTIGDIRDLALVERELQRFRPDLVLHLAAQALVRRSYRDPVGTIATNVLGTAHVLEAARRCPSVRGVVCVTTDKCYENKEWVWGYRETDPLGGKDIYSASKAASEIVAHAYRQSLLPLDNDRLALATARGGNVVGGGDWSEDRLVPDIIRALNAGNTLVLRNPQATRPWQHVLELLNGYLTLGRLLLEYPNLASSAWNFGPERGNEATVERLVNILGVAYDGVGARIEVVPSELAEANALKLDISKATDMLPWKPHLDFEKTMTMTADWYRGFYREDRNSAQMLTEQIEEYSSKFL